MLTMLKNWKGRVEINGEEFDSIDAFISSGKSLSASIDIKLLAEKKASSAVESKQYEKQSIESVESDTVYRITVKQYMTRKTEAGSSFDFMLKWNNDIPMPLRTMVGTIEKETRGMVRMKLHGQAEATCNCLRCGRDLTNKVSRYYGIGPECMQKLGMIRMDINDIEGITEKLTEVSWEGWIVKSAITSKEVVA